MPLSPVPARPLLRDEALTRLRAAIVEGDLPPGALVKDADLAALLGLGVAPVRAALARLVDEGLVETKPQSHTRVTPCTDGQAHDAGVVLRAMHELATAAAAGRLTDGDVTAMRTANRRFAVAVEAGDVAAAMAADDDLHGVVLHRCANAAVVATAERFTPVVRRLERQRFGSAHGRDSVALHERLIDACSARDVGAAVAVTTEIWTALLSELSPPPTEETAR